MALLSDFLAAYAGVCSLITLSVLAIEHYCMSSDSKAEKLCSRLLNPGVPLLSQAGVLGA